MADGLFQRIFGRLTGARREDTLARYVIAECHKGRPIGEVLEDPYIKNRADDTTIRRILDHPEVVRAVGSDSVDRLREQLRSLS